MKTKNRTNTLLSLLAAATTFLAVNSAGAAALYHVTIDTSSLIGDSGAPFALDFLLTGGNALSNTVTITNFSFGVGGSATSDPAVTTFGLATGNLLSSVTLSDDASNFSNELYQGFIPGNVLEFDVNLTANLNGPTPDSFSFAILDENLANIPTTGFGNSLFVIDINSATPSVQTFTSTSGVSVVAVPEPSTAALFGSAAFGAFGLIRRRRA
jgi:hypothetical protein